MESEKLLPAVTDQELSLSWFFSINESDREQQYTAKEGGRKWATETISVAARVANSSRTEARQAGTLSFCFESSRQQIVVGEYSR